MRTRTLTAGAVTVVAAGAITAVAVWPAEAATTPVGDGVYTLAAGASGKCIDVTGSSVDNSALLVQVACNASATHMQWKAVARGNGQFNLANVNSTRCIDVPSSSTTSGTQLQQYGCGDGTKTNQLWTFTASSATAGKYLVKSVATGLCISDKDGSTAGNNPIVEETCSDIARMQWSFNYVAGPTGTASPTVAPTPSTTTAPPPTGPAVAFPGAVGFGAVATGGRGGSVYHVTNLNDSGSGSFRDAVSASNRIVVFDVGGYISLSSAVSVKSNLTIAGQTAPGGGIGIMAREVSFANSTNVIVRNVRFRQGDLDPNDEKSGINLYNGSKLIFDHVSIEFAQWNNIDAVGATNITVQYSIDADPIGQQFAAHTETGPYTWYNNLFANAHNRCPLAKANTQYINNVVYNYQAGYTAGNSSGHFLHDVIGNYFITGPRTTNSSNAYYQMGNQSVYNSGNIIDSNKDGVLNGSTLGVGGGGTAMSSPWSATTSTIPAVSAANAYNNVVAKAGALPRDQVDTLVVKDVQSLGKAGDLWAHQTSTGLSNNGYGTIAGGTAPTDTDRDGMPDAWENAHGLNSNNASDATGDFDHTGYTNVEKYINGLLDGTYH
ncbi:RICIN domain-containing protein [Dactylosporangium sp. NPDC051541]|uniref:RICIN domain-containing protein n=1 Tax=Dactylosporangium sp. NPDC051541 TaxID=3363977 RepID=UPI0037A8E869